MKKLAFAALLGLAAACTTTEERIGGAAVGATGAAAGPAMADTLQTNTRRARRR